MTPVISFPSASATGTSSTMENTSIVYEHLCLYTPDLRRKQKRWQDGRLKYHTFNNRIMVYDERGNFVGDMHWHEAHTFGEGEEVQLDRGGVIVQVAECIGQKAQDLSELLEKRVQEREQRQARSTARAGISTPMRLPNTALHTSLTTEQRRRPLQDVIGTPSSYIGRAVVPTTSPFERRRESEQGEIRMSRSLAATRRQSPPPKKSGYAQQLFGTQLTLSCVPTSSAPLRRGNSVTHQVSTASLGSCPAPRTSIEAEVTTTRKVTNPSNYGANRDEPSQPSAPPYDRRARQIDVTGPGPQVIDYGVTDSQYRTTALPSPSLCPALSGGERTDDENDADIQRVAGSRAVSRHDLVPEVSGGSVQGRKHLKRRRESSSRDSEGRTSTSGMSTSPSSVKILEDFPKQPRLTRTLAPEPYQHSNSLSKASVTGVTRVAEKITKHAIADDGKQEPKTSLRIKPRRKRGLLLATKKAALNQNTMPQESYVKGSIIETYSRNAVSGDAGSVLPRSSHMSHNGHAPVDTQLLATPRVNSNRPFREVHSLAARTARADYSAGRAGDGETGHVENAYGDVDEGYGQDSASAARLLNARASDSSGYLRRSRKDVSQTYGADDSASSSDSARESNREQRRTPIMPRPAVSGPRLARLGRKSVKSREVIGFIDSSPAASLEVLQLGRQVPLATSGSEELFSMQGHLGPGRSSIVGPVLERGLNKQSSHHDTHLAPGTLDQQGAASGSLGDQEHVSTPMSELAVPGSLDSRPTIARQDAGDDLLHVPHSLAELSSRHPIEHTEATTKDMGSSVGQVSSHSSATSRNRAEVVLGQTRCTPSIVFRAEGKHVDAVDRTTSPLGIVGQGMQLETKTACLGGDRGTEVGAVLDCDDVQRQARRLTNPATRGRKAALKSDAAGQTPQSFLPVDAYAGRPPVRAPELAASKEAPRRKMRFPGFTSATSAGPWSREAHDLLELGRPV